MKTTRYKVITDLLSIIFTLTAIITGFMLHNQVWHLHVYNDTLLWGSHETVGIALIAFIAVHCIQHSFWFKNYSKIQTTRKRVTTILLILGIIVGITGTVLMLGSRSETVSHIHYVGGILFTAVATGHVLKRLKMLKSLIGK